MTYAQLVAGSATPPIILPRPFRDWLESVTVFDMAASYEGYYSWVNFYITNGEPNPFGCWQRWRKHGIDPDLQTFEQLALVQVIRMGGMDRVVMERLWNRYKGVDNAPR